MLEDKLLFFFKDLLNHLLVILGKLFNVVGVLYIKLFESWNTVAQFFFLGSCLLGLVLLLLLLVSVLSTLQKFTCSTALSLVVIQFLLSIQ